MEWHGAGSALDLGRFPSVEAPGWIDVVFPSVRQATGGALGLVAWCEEGAAVAAILQDPRPPLGSLPVWTEDPPEDGRGGPSGYCRFHAIEGQDGEMRVTLRLAVLGPERPLRIELPWTVVETGAERDTLPGPAASVASLTVLGGPSSVRRRPVIHALTPRLARAGASIRVLGASLEEKLSCSLTDAQGTEWALWPIDRPSGESLTLRLPPDLPEGAAYLSLNGSRIAWGALRILSERAGQGFLVDTVWHPVDGDCLVVAADQIYDYLTPLIDDLRARGYRPSSARLGDLVAAYGLAQREDAMRQAVEDACASFSVHPLALLLVGAASEDSPEKDILPTMHVAYAHEFPGYYDDTYADDGMFGDLSTSADLEPELIVGRIPVRMPGALASYMSKLVAYRSQPPRPVVLLAVGDANINRDNSDRGRAASSLAETVAETGFLQPEIQQASSYMPLDNPQNRQRALSDFLGLLSSGVGLLELFGNNTGPTDLVHMLEAPPGPSLPHLTASMMPTDGKLPIALLHTCLNGAFDEDLHFGDRESPAEEWVGHPARGVVALIAQSHITTFFDDWELGQRILERLARADGALLGAIHAGVRSILLRQDRTERSVHSIRMANLLGDPLLAPVLGIDQVRLDGSFDVSGSWPTQDRLCFERGWTTADFDSARCVARVVYGGVHPPPAGGATEGPVYPVRGSRMLRVGGLHGMGEGRRAAAWTVFRCDLLVREGSVLSYWVRQEADPQGVGRLAVDAITETGRLMSLDLLDGGGLPADPRRYRYGLGEWHHVFVRLDRWEGERIREIFVRYDAANRAAGTPLPHEEALGGPGTEGPGMRAGPLAAGASLGGYFAGYVDEIQIETEAGDAILDGEFAIDADRDGSLDYWVGPWPSNDQPESASGVSIEGDDGVELWLGQQVAGPFGLGQLIQSSDSELGSFVLDLSARSLSAASLRVALVDPLTGEARDEATVGPLGEAWEDREILLGSSSAGPLLLELTACGGPVGVRGLRKGELTPCETPKGDGGGAVAPRLGPNPTTGRLRLVWDLHGDRSARIDLFDVSGRHVDTMRPQEEGGRDGAWWWQLRAPAGTALPPGVYFVRFQSRQGSFARTIQVVR